MIVLVIVSVLFFLIVLRLLHSFFIGFDYKKNDFWLNENQDLFDKISIGSYNLWLLSIRLFGFKLLEPAGFIKQRLKNLPDKILDSDIDVLFFQEIYKEKHKKFLIEKLKKKYPYCLYYKKKMKFDFSMQNWLLLVSKFPICSYDFVPLKNLLFHERLMVNKWFLAVRLNIWNGKNISIVNWHNVARWVFSNERANIVVEYKKKQIMQIICYAKENSIDLIVWDYNCGPNFFVDVYKSFKKNGFIDVFEFKYPWKEFVTWDVDNPLTHTNFFPWTPSQRDDHIFINKNVMKRFSILDTKILFDKSDLNVWDFFIPLSDHFGVWVWIKK